jgi:hypothetical protein
MPTLHQCTPSALKDSHTVSLTRRSPELPSISAFISPPTVLFEGKRSANVVSRLDERVRGRFGFRFQSLQLDPWSNELLALLPMETSVHALPAVPRTRRENESTRAGDG